jgi:hypothetical protein
MSIKNKLEAIGFFLADEISESENGRDSFFATEGCRLIVGPITSAAIAKEGQPTRLGSSANLTEDELKQNNSLQETHPFRIACDIAMHTAALALDFAITGAGNLENLKRCLRIDLYVAATPNFERCGMIGARVADLYIAAFGVEFRPVVVTTCVAANPRGALFSMTLEFVMESAHA